IDRPRRRLLRARPADRRDPAVPPEGRRDQRDRVQLGGRASRPRSIVITTVLIPDRTAVDVILRDGAILRVRQADAGDEAILSGLLASLSARSIGFRFFSPTNDIGGAAHRLLAQARSRNLLAFSRATPVAPPCLTPVTPDSP